MNTQESLSTHSGQSPGKGPHETDRGDRAAKTPRTRGEICHFSLTILASHWTQSQGTCKIHKAHWTPNRINSKQCQDIPLTTETDGFLTSRQTRQVPLHTEQHERQVSLPNHGGRLTGNLEGLIVTATQNTTPRENAGKASEIKMFLDEGRKLGQQSCSKRNAKGSSSGRK